MDPLPHNHTTPAGAAVRLLLDLEREIDAHHLQRERVKQSLLYVRGKDGRRSRSRSDRY